MLDRRSTLAALLAATLAVAALAAGQADEPPGLRVTVDRAELKWSATGRLLGWLERGARVERLGDRAGWIRGRVRGWMPLSALSTIEGGFEIAPEEEVLRESPAGGAIGGLVRGVEVRRVGGSGEWYQVEMIGWMADSTVIPIEPAPEPDTRAGAPREAREAPPLMGRLSNRSGLRTAPEGAELVPLPAGTVVRAHETRGGWTRVTIEGWVPAGAVAAGGEIDVDPEIVAGAPAGAFVGREVAWTLEHVTLQTADEWRSDLVPGETFGLARVPGAGGLYVYLAIPDRLVPRFRELPPFATVRVEGRVRTGRSALTGAPILDVTRVHR